MNDRTNHPEVELRDVDIIFGDRQAEAVAMLDAGATREKILTDTGAVVGVCDATLSVYKGEICVLMGLSGSGKSTLLRAINGLNKVTRGQVFIYDNDNQVDVANIGFTQLREIRMNRVSMVFQQFALLPWRTVAENVAFGLELKGVPKSERTAIIDEKLEMVGLIQWRDKYAHELSGGMQQRVGLARAFATDADILLMDEPFSALDPLIRTRLQDEMLELQDRLHKTILFVSHDLDEALKLGNNIAIMESGKIVQFATPEEIVLNPINQYVADFVAHMNPVGVLKAKSIMSPIDEYRNDDGTYNLDEANIILSIASDGKLGEATRNSEPISVHDWESENEVQAGKIYCASIDISMKGTIEICHVSRYPVLLYDADKRIVGVVGENEIYAAILHKRNPVDFSSTEVG